MKQKVCSRCEKPRRIWANNMCKSCDIVTSPSKYMIKRSEIKKTTTKSKKKPLPTISKLKKELDDIFSKYIRLRDADNEGYVACFTSGKIEHWKKLHAGHYISRRHMATRWHEINVQPQSVAENIYNQGNSPQFAVNLDKKYGVGTAEMLLNLSKESVKFNRDDYMRMINEYTLKVAQYNL